LSPTRELTKQIGKVFETVAAGSLSVLTVYGGVPYDQQGTALRAGVDIVVGTPGRVMDFMDRGQLKMDKIRFFVLDEADEMLNIGFKQHVDKIFACVVGDMGEGAGADDQRQTEVQTLLFSATVPPWVKEVTTKYFKKETTVNVDLVSGPHPMPLHLPAHAPASSCSLVDWRGHKDWN
jgi:ATP-dependent RNA helicase DDX21